MLIPDGVLSPTERLSLALRSVYFDAGYDRFRMAKFEEYDLYARNKKVLIDENVIAFTDRDGRLMALKPDVTLSIIKNTKDDLSALRKLYYTENVYRVPKGSGSFREIMQAGIECIGAIDRSVLCEVLDLAAESLQVVSEESVVELSHMGILSHLFDRFGFGYETRKQTLAAMEARSMHGLQLVLHDAGAGEREAAVFENLLKAYGSLDESSALLERSVAPCVSEDVWAPFASVLKSVSASRSASRFRLNFSLVNDTDYYDGFVFAGYVNGISERVLSGGQYDGLMRNMGRSSGGVGFAVYLDRIDGIGGVA